MTLIDWIDSCPSSPLCAPSSPWGGEWGPSRTPALSPAHSVSSEDLSGEQRRKTWLTQINSWISLCFPLWWNVLARLRWLTPSASPTDTFFPLSENLESIAGFSVCSRFRTMYVCRGALSGSNQAAKGQWGMTLCMFAHGLFHVTHSTSPPAWLIVVQPFPNDGGHVHHVGQVVQKDVVVFAEGQWMEGGPQAAQPIDVRRLDLGEHLHEDMSSQWLETWAFKETRPSPPLPAALWWTCAGGAVLSRGDTEEAWPLQRAPRRETWTCPHASCRCRGGPPTGPGTAYMLLWRDVVSAWKEAGARH